MQGDGPESSEIAESVGGAVRRARTARGASMRALAARAGISQPMLSKVENGQILPSLTTVYALAGALDIPASRMLPSVAGADASLEFEVGESATTTRASLLSGGADASFHVYRVSGTAGQDDGHDFIHPGPEFVFVVGGVVELNRTGLDPMRLSAGQTITYDSEVAHRWSVIEDAEYLLVSPA